MEIQIPANREDFKTYEGTSGNDTFIISSGNHGYPSLSGNGGIDIYRLAEDVDARGKTPHQLSEGGGAPDIEIQQDDFIYLPKGVDPKDIVFWNSVSFSKTRKKAKTTIIYDPHGLYKKLWVPSPRFAWSWYEGDIFFGGAVSSLDGIIQGDPRVMSAYNERTLGTADYKEYERQNAKYLADLFSNRPFWRYEADRLAEIRMWGTSNILDIVSRIFQSDGTPAFIGTSPARIATTNIDLNRNYDVTEVLASLAVSTQSGTFQTEISDRSLTINASSWTGSIKINFAAKAAAEGERLDAKQIDFSSATPAGSILQGGDGNDQLWGKAGWDVFDGGKGNDLIRAGNGRDILTGGFGADELHGDFGWNTYKSEKDGFSDLIAIKSDQHLSNWIYGKAGNNANGEKADIIEGLDANDKIRIIGVFSPDITVRAGATAHGVSGIGIYAKGALEALYTGGDLSIAQLTAMTSGDGSAAALNNQVSSYGWTGV